MKTKGKPKSVELICSACGIRFSRSASEVKRKQASGQQNFYCTRRCALVRR